jgi:hypothetical protein
MWTTARKATVAIIATGISIALILRGDGFTAEEIGQIIGAMVTTGVSVYWTPRNDDPPEGTL